MARDDLPRLPRPHLPPWPLRSVLVRAASGAASETVCTVRWEGLDLRVSRRVGARTDASLPTVRNGGAGEWKGGGVMPVFKITFSREFAVTVEAKTREEAEEAADEECGEIDYKYDPSPWEASVCPTKGPNADGLCVVDGAIVDIGDARRGGYDPDATNEADRERELLARNLALPGVK